MVSSVNIVIYYLLLVLPQLSLLILNLSEKGGLNGAVAFTVNGKYFGFFTANG